MTKSIFSVLALVAAFPAYSVSAETALSSISITVPQGRVQ